jgi:hypothetical protein
MLFITALIVTLVVGDFGSTFFYHVPQHLWFTLHLRTHHDRRRPYFDHAVLSTDPAVLLDGFLGAVPYMVVAGLLWRLSWAGTGSASRLVAAHYGAGLANPGLGPHPLAPAWSRPSRGPRRAPPKPRIGVWRHLPLLRCAGSGAFG